MFDKCDVPSGAGAATGFGHSLTTLPQLAAEDSDKASGESAQPVLQVSATAPAMSATAHISAGRSDAAMS